MLGIAIVLVLVVLVVVVVVVVVVVWVMKYHEVRSATCHCKGLGRVLTRQLEPLFLLSLPPPREFNQTARAAPPTPLLPDDLCDRPTCRSSSMDGDT